MIKKSAFFITLLCTQAASADFLLPSKFANQNISLSWSNYTLQYLRDNQDTDFELSTLGAMYQSELGDFEAFYGFGFATDAKRSSISDSSFLTSGDTGYILTGGVSGELSQFPARWFVSGALTELKFGNFGSSTVSNEYSGLSLTTGISTEMEISNELSISGLASVRLLDDGEIVRSNSADSFTYTSEKDTRLGARLAAHYTLSNDTTVSGTVALFDGKGFELAVQRELF